MVNCFHVSRVIIISCIIFVLAACGEDSVETNSSISNNENTENTSPDTSMSPEARQGQELYESITQGCLNCHGVDGQSTTFKAIDLTASSYQHSSSQGINYSLEEYIVQWMPVSDTSMCSGDCARNIAAYIRFMADNSDPDSGSDPETPQPIADATASQNLNGFAPLTTNFTASSNQPEGLEVNYQWDFGDGTTGEGLTQNHEYNNPGTYQVQLTVMDSNGNSATTSLTVVARENTAPEAVVSVSTATGIAPLTVNFSADNSTDDQGIAAYQWSIMGSNINGTSAEYTFTEAGTYEVTLTVRDNNGLEGTATQIITVANPDVNIAPVADASLSNPLSGPAPLTVTFDGSASEDERGQIARYLWVFDGGQQVEGMRVTRTFETAGDYTVRLIVEDAEGLSNQVDIVVQVADASVSCNDLNAHFESEIFPVFQGSACVNCHINSSSGGFQMPANNMSAAYDAFSQRAAVEVGGRPLILAKPSGAINHGGGVLWTTDSPEYQQVSAFVEQVLECNSASPDPDPNPNDENPYACADPVADTSSENELKRLSKLQYSNTLRDLLARLNNSSQETTIFNSLPLDGLPDDESEDHHFDRFDQRMMTEHVSAHLDIALAFAQGVSSDANALEAFTGASCTRAGTEQSCLNQVLANIGPIILRRPLITEDIQLYQQAGSYENLIASLLVSPSFLFLEEHRGEANTEGNVMLTNHELAARLSYHFWNTMPDNRLRADADSGAITTNYQAVVDRVFNDPRTRENLHEFYRGWLNLDAIPEFSTSAVQRNNFLALNYGSGNNFSADIDLSEYRQAAVQEILDLADYYTWEAVSGSLDDLYTSNISFASSADLARAYGVPTWQRGNYNDLVLFNSSQPRAGILTRAALQMYGGFASRPIMKGARIRKELLCDTMAPTPANTAAPESAVVEDHYSTRERVQAITEISGTDCAGCHAVQINPLGFPTESYDVLGRYRTFEAIFNLDTGVQEFTADVNTTTIPQVESTDTRVANNALDLSRYVGESHKSQACFVRYYYEYSKRREENLATDSCELNTLYQVQSDEGLVGLFKSIALLPEFRWR